MNANSDDNLSRALTLLKQSARDRKPASKSGIGDSSDIGELFLAELRMRRARLRQWIDMLNQEADCEAPRTQKVKGRMAPQSCRGRRREAMPAQ